jgi:diacylglycerol kinase family enzyme
LARLVVAGGDGTLNEVLNGLSNPSQVPIAVFPLGTANVMAKELGLTDDPEAFVALLEQGAVRRLDMGRIGERRFLLFVSVGLEAAVTKEVSRSSRLGTWYWRYFLPLVRTLIRYRAPTLTVTVDDRSSLTCGMVLISNIKHYWSIFSMTERAACDSGHFDIRIIPRGRITCLVRYYLGSTPRSFIKIGKFPYITGKQILIDSHKRVDVQLDGDYFGTTPIRIDLEEAVVPMIASADRNDDIARIA